MENGVDEGHQPDAERSLSGTSAQAAGSNKNESPSAHDIGTCASATE